MLTLPVFTYYESVLQRLLRLVAVAQYGLYILHALAQRVHGLVKFVLQGIHKFAHGNDLVHPEYGVFSCWQVLTQWKMHLKGFFRPSRAALMKSLHKARPGMPTGLRMMVTSSCLAAR